MRNVSICLATAALLVPAAGNAQNKCVDPKGKVFYQQDPCPGAARAPAKQPAEPVRAAAPPPPAGPSSTALRAEHAEMARCASDWDMHAGSFQRNRDENARRKTQGHDTARNEMLDTQQLENAMARFLPVCGKYGFAAPRDQQAMQRNSAAAQDLYRKADAKQAEYEAAGKRETAAASRAVTPERGSRNAHDRAQLERECAAARGQIAEMRANRSQVAPQLLKTFDGNLARAELQFDRNCK